jgi:hypothetical protein
VTVVPRRNAARRTRRDPHLAQPEIQCEFEFRQRRFGCVEIAQRNPMQTRIRRAESSHRTVVRAVRRVTQRRIRDTEQRRAQRRVHHLCFEAEQIQRRAAFGRVDGAERVVPLRTLAQQIVAERDRRVAFSAERRWPSPAGRSAPRNRRQIGADARRCVLSQERRHSIRWLSASITRRAFA